MAKILSWSGQGLADQAMTTSSVGTGDNAFNAVQGAVTVAGGRQRSGAGALTAYTTWNIGSTLTAYAVRAYIAIDAYPATGATGLISAELAAAQMWRVSTSSAGAIQLRDGGNATLATGPVLTATAEYRIEVVVSGTAASLRVYNADGVSIYNSGDKVITAGGMSTIKFGKIVTIDYGPTYFDNMAVGDTATEIGSISETPPPAASGKKIALIGDSMLRQGGSGEALYRAELVQRGWGAADTFFYAADGKRINTADVNGFTTADVIAQARVAIGEPDVWVIALGLDGRSDDDVTTSTGISNVLTAIGTTAKVIWVNVGIKSLVDTDVARRNLVIQSTIFVRGGLSKTADWSAFIHDGRDETSIWNASGIALTQAGFQERVRFLGLTVGDALRVQPTSSSDSARSVRPWTTATLAGTDTAPSGTVSTRKWRQVAGTPVTLSGTGASRTYSVPPTVDGEILRFGYKVVDNAGLDSPEFIVNQHSLPVNERAYINGVQVPMRILQPSQMQ